ncbi:MAG: oligosaccharide flippase family protein [Lentisphaeria bacterium]|nr:oligosaccharide flippase family protein [Lentisphaeria bacterium]
MERIPVVKNTLTNYVIMFVQLLQGVFVTRYMVKYLPTEEYGMWSLMWSFFVYTFLLDFGLGITVQKYTSTQLYKKDLEQYNAMMSSIFTYFLYAGLIIIGFTFVIMWLLPQLAKNVNMSRLGYYRQCLFFFGLGTAGVVPTTIFPGILLGINKIYIRNYINIASRIIQLFANIILLVSHFELLSIVICNMSISIMTNLAMAVAIFHFISGFRLRLKIDFKACRSMLNFSLIMYVILIINLLLDKGTYLLLSAFTGLTSVANFHLGGRLPDLVRQASSAFQENMNQASAAMHAQGEHETLSRLLLNGMRMNSFIACCFGIIGYALVPEALFILFKVVDPDVMQICRVIMLTTVSQVALCNIPHTFMTMAERHRQLAIYRGVELVLQLGVSILLLLLTDYGVLGIVWTILIVRTCVGLHILGYQVCRYIQHSLVSVIWKVHCLPLLATILPVLSIVVLRQMLFGDKPLVLFLVGGSVAALLYLVICYGLLLNHEERGLAISKVTDFMEKIKH